MSTKSMMAGFVMVLTSTMGCSAPTDGDEFEEVSSSEVSSAFMSIDDAPRLPAPQLTVPVLEPFRARPPIWDIQHYFDELRTPQFGHCYMYWLTLLEPSGSTKQVPVTVCK